MGRALMSAVPEPRIAARRTNGVEPVIFGGRQRQPDRGRLAHRRRAADDHLADRPGDLARGLAAHLDELRGQAALVDEVDRVVAPAERGPEAGRRTRGGVGDLRDDAESQGVRAARRQDRGRGLHRLALEGAGHADDGGRAVDDLPGELAEEPPPIDVRGGRATGTTGAPSSAVAVEGTGSAVGWPVGPSAGTGCGPVARVVGGAVGQRGPLGVDAEDAPTAPEARRPRVSTG